jgi:hypothetical protein
MSTPPECIILNANSICGREYNGFPVLQSTFSSQESVDSFIELNVISQSNVEKAFTTSYGCTDGASLSTAIASRRFHTSFQCSSIVDDAINKGCTFDTSKYPASGPVLCDEECETAVSSLEAIFNSQSSCPATTSGPVQRSRDNLVSRYSTYCASASQVASAQQGLCVTGARVDITHCGFASKASSQIGCKSIPENSCCQEVLDAMKKSPGDGKGEDQESVDEAGSSLGIGAIVAIVAGVAFFVILLIVLLFVKRRKNTETEPSNRGTDQYLKHSRSSKHASISQERLNPNPNHDPYYGGNTYEDAPFTSRVSIPPVSATSDNQDLYYNSTGKAGSTQSQPTSAKSMPTAIPRKEPVPPQRQPPAPSDSKLMVAIHPYYPTLADELRLEVGDDVLLLKAFDGMFLRVF